MGVMHEQARRVSRMKVGQCLVYTREFIQDSFPDNPLTGELGIERFKSNIMSAAWNYVFTTNIETGNLHIRRIEPDGKMRHVDYDRSLYFDEVNGVYRVHQPTDIRV